MAECKNRELFRSEAKIIVELKWKQLKYYVYLQNSLLLMYVLYLILCKLLVIRDHIGLLIFTILVTIPEVQQNYESVRNLMGLNDAAEFGFEDVQNFYELSGYLLQLTYILMRLIQQGGYEYDKSTIKGMNNVNLASCILIFVRTFFLLRMFSSLRPLIRMIKEVLLALIPFTVVLFFPCFFFSAATFILEEKHYLLGEKEGQKEPQYLAFGEDQISIIASGQYSDANTPTTLVGFLFYLSAFFFVVVVMMNLIIAYITERYQVILEQTIPMECKERCVLLNEIEGFVNFLEKFGANAGTGSADGAKHYYYHFARYQVDPDLKNAANVEVEGRMRAMMTKIKKII